MPTITTEQEVIINLFSQIIDLCNLFVSYCASLFTTMALILTQDLATLSVKLSNSLPLVFKGPLFTLITNWFINNPDASIAQLSLLQLMFGGGFLIFLGITIIKWIIGIVT